MNRKKQVWLTFLFIFLLLIPLSYGMAMNDNTIERTFTVTPGGTLIIDSDFGSIEVNTAADSKVNIAVIQKFNGWDKRKIKDFMDNFNIDFSQSGNDVTVTAKSQKKRSWGWNDVKIKFLVQVPRDYNVNLKTAGGSISVEDLMGAAKAHTSGGSLTFGNISGPVTGKTSGGSISLESSEGDADLKTSGGSINTGKVKGGVDAQTSGGSITIKKAGGAVTAKTSGGSINVEEVMGSIDAKTSGGSVTAHITRQPPGNSRLETSGGSVTLYLADGIAVDIDAKTGRGKVKSDLDISGERDENVRWIKGKINGGGPEVYLRTSGGNVYLKKQ